MLIRFTKLEKNVGKKTSLFVLDDDREHMDDRVFSGAKKMLLLLNNFGVEERGVSFLGVLAHSTLNVTPLVSVLD